MSELIFTLPKWKDRPPEIAYLLNPAFLAVLLCEFVSGYAKSNNKKVSFPLLFLVLPMVLHEPTRVALPKNIQADFMTWVQEHPELQYDYPSRAKLLVPYAKEAIFFAIQKHVLVEYNGTFSSLPNNLNNTNTEPIYDSNYQKKSSFLGHWFANTGSDVTIFRLLGVKP